MIDDETQAQEQTQEQEQEQDDTCLKFDTFDKIIKSINEISEDYKSEHQLSEVARVIESMMRDEVFKFITPNFFNVIVKTISEKSYKIGFTNAKVEDNPYEKRLLKLENKIEEMREQIEEHEQGFTSIWNEDE